MGTFLSRLCGGEDFSKCRVCSTNFLSRLCGGEVEMEDSPDTYVFLSRLCGGEESAIFWAISSSISKPPMWR